MCQQLVIDKREAAKMRQQAMMQKMLAGKSAPVPPRPAAPQAAPRPAAPQAPPSVVTRRSELEAVSERLIHTTVQEGAE